VDSGNIDEGAVTADEIKAGSVVADKIAAGSITAAKIATDAVEADKIKANAVTAAKIAADAVEADKIKAGAVTATKLSVASLSAISADMGELTAGVIKMGTGTKDDDLDGFQIDADEIVGQENGVDQVSLRASDGRIIAGGGAVVLDADGVHCTSGNASVNKHKIKDGADIIAALFGELEDLVGSSVTLDAAGKNSDAPEASLELVARTYNGVAAAGVASISLTMTTSNGKLTLGGAVQVVLGDVYVDLVEMASAPAAPGTDRARLFVQDDGAGKTQLCVIFNTGAVQVIATQP
jgi:hypothetical protein